MISEHPWGQFSFQQGLKTWSQGCHLAVPLPQPPSCLLSCLGLWTLFPSLNPKA
jgi:hypothetical protein